MTAVSSRSLARTILFATAIAVALLAFTATRSSAAYTITDFQLTPSPLPTPAGGHPNMHYHVDPDANKAGSDDLKKVVLDFPAGLLGNPEAASPKCVATGTGSANKFASDNCPSTSYIGSMLIKWKEPLGNLTSAPGSVYVLSPATAGSAATIGFIVRPQGWRKIFLKTEVAGIVTVRASTESDYGLTLSVDNIPRVLTSSSGFTYPITLSDISVNINARAGGSSITSPNGAYFAFNPTRCDAATTRATITSYSNVKITKSSSYTPTGCSDVQFTPSASVTPTVTTPGAATGVTATFGVPTADAPIQQSHVRSIQTDLPTGTGLNFPAIGAVPALCTEAKLNTDTCPSGSKIGTVSAVVPFLPPTMTGDVYLLTRNSSITFGYILRGANGVKAPLKGSAAAIDSDGDGGADRVRATASTMPQVPWTSATINFTSKLILNPTNACGPNTVTSTLNGWSGKSATLSNSWFGVANCAPETTIDSGPSGSVTTTTATFGFSSTTSGATFECSLDGAVYAACASPITYSGLARTAHTFCVRATSGGLTDQTPACRNWTIFSNPPSIGGVSINPLTPTSARITYTATDDSGVPPVCTPASGSTISILSSGTTNVLVTCADEEGNVSTRSASYYNPGGGPIALSITTGPPSTTTDPTPFFEWAVNQPVTGPFPCPPGQPCIQVIVPLISFACTMDDESVPCDGLTYTSPALPLGEHEFCVSAHGIYSGQNSNVACRTFTVSLTPPEPPFVVITSPATTPTTTSDSPINVAYTVNGSTTLPAGMTCTVKGAPSTDPTTNWVALVVGSNTISVSCADANGTGTATAVVTRTATSAFTPTFHQTLSGNSPGAGTDIHWEIGHPAGAEPLRRARILLDPNIAPNFAAFGTTSDMCPYIVGTSYFDVSSCPAQARIGTVSIYSTSYSTTLTGNAYLINRQPIPYIGIDVSAAIPGNPGSVSFQILISSSLPKIDPSCDDATSELGYCQTQLAMLLQEIPNIGVTSITADLGGTPRIGSGGPLAAQLFVIGTDACGSATSLTTTAQFTGWSGATASVADPDPLICPGAPPSISVTSPTVPWTQAATATLNYTVDPGDGDTPTCTIPSGTTIPLVDGPNTITLSCTNSTGQDTRNVRITRDNRAPTITIVSPTLGAHYNAGSLPSLLYTVTDDWDPSPICTPAPGPITNPVQGANVVSVMCTDHAGNSATAQRTFTFDSIVPVISASCTAAGIGAYTCTFTATESVTFTCRVDGGPTTACSSPFTTPPLPVDVQHTITICATDLAGNTSCTVITVGSPLPGNVNILEYAKPAAAPGSAATVSFTPAVAECRVDDGPYSACSSPWSVPTGGLSSPAEHTYDIRTGGATPGSPVRGHIWIDQRPYGASATVVRQANTLTTAAAVTNAGAHPDVTASISMTGADDTRIVSIQFPDGLMGSLRSVPVAARCVLADANSGNCPATAEIGTITGTMEFANGGLVTADGTVYLVDSGDMSSQSVAGAAISLKNIPGGHGDLNVVGSLTLVDNARAMRLSTTDLPRQTSNGDKFHLLSGSVTVRGDVGGAADPLITNPHFCGPVNVNRAGADDFVGNAVSWEGATLPTVTAAYPTTGCASVPFNPSISTSFSSLEAGTETAMTASLTMPADNSSVRLAVMKLPSFIAPNFPAFGASTDQCSSGSYAGGSTGSYTPSASAFGTSTNAYRSFTTANCPPQARVGTAEFTSPLIPGTITGDVYLSGASPIPNIGIYVDPTKYGNPKGITFGLFGLSATPQIDPLCDPATSETGDCPTQIQEQFSSLPDVPLSTMTISVGTVTGRVSSYSGDPLPAGVMVIATASDPACTNAGMNLTTTLTPWSSTTVANRSQLITPTGCNQ